MKTKICTSIEQSKKLIELGIDENTADMVYLMDVTMPNGENRLLPKTDIAATDGENLPAWSLSSLENFIPCGIKSDDNLTYLFNKWKRLDDWKCAYHIDDNEYISFSGNNFDVIYEMVCWILKR